MKNIIKKIGGLCLGLALLSGVSVGISSTKAKEVKAGEELVYTLTPAKGSNNSYGGNCDITIGTIVWNLTGNSQMIPWRLGGNSIANVDRTVYSKTVIQDDILKIELDVGKASSITVNAVKLIYSKNADFSSSNEITKTFAASSTITFSPDTGTLGSNNYYKFVFNVSVSGTSNKFLEFTEARFYKETGGASTYTVTYNGNENTGGSVPIDANKYEAGATVTVLGNVNFLERTGYSFAGWNSKSDGTGTDYAVNSTFPISSTTTLYAKWTPNQYTLSFNLNNGSGTTPSSITADYDSQITLPDETGISREGYGLLGWNTSADGTGDNYQLGGSYKMGLSTTLYAKWAEKGAAYKLVTDASDLHAGDIIAIVNNDGYALSTTQASNNRTATSITIDSNYFLATSEVQEIVLGGDSAGWTFDVGTGYLYAAGGTGNNYLRTKTDLSASSYWSISITDNVSTIKTTDTATTKNWVRFNLNSGNPVFSCYSSGQKDVQIYKKYTSASFAKELLDKTDTICSTSGEHIASDFSTIWSELAGSQCWSLLTAAEKSVFASSTIDPSGSITEQAAARYDQLVHKYALENFANRSISSVNQNLISIIGENSAATWIIVAVSLAGLTAIGGYFFYKKRKENF